MGLLALCWQARGAVLFDRQAMSWLPVATEGSWQWDASSLVSNLASGPVRIPLAILCAAIVAFSTRDFWWAAAFPIAPAFATGLREILQLAAQRPRPPTAAVFGELGYGFPSGHSTGICASLAVIVLFVWLATASSKLRWGTAAPAATICLGVGLSRLLLGVHYPTDVVGGFLLGTATSLLVCALIVGPLRSSVRNREGSGRPEADSPSSAPAA